MNESYLKGILVYPEPPAIHDATSGELIEGEQVVVVGKGRR
jgi:hypothetical protein